VRLVVGGYFGWHLQHDGRKEEVRLNGINERWQTNMSHRRGGRGVSVAVIPNLVSPATLWRLRVDKCHWGVEKEAEGKDSLIDMELRTAPHRFYRKPQNRKNRLVFSTKFNFQNLGEKNENQVVFPVYQLVFGQFFI
jgi:hypothetical protein